MRNVVLILILAVLAGACGMTSDTSVTQQQEACSPDCTPGGDDQGDWIDPGSPAAQVASCALEDFDATIQTRIHCILSYSNGKVVCCQRFVENGPSNAGACCSATAQLFECHYTWDVYTEFNKAFQ